MLLLLLLGAFETARLFLLGRKAGRLRIASGMDRRRRRVAALVAHRDVAIAISVGPRARRSLFPVQAQRAP